MALRSPALSFALVLGGFVPCLAQQPTGSATLDQVLPPAVVQGQPATADLPVAQTKATERFLVRPKDGVTHKQLDKAWAEYEVAKMKAAEGVRTAIAKQFELATSKGNLDAAKKWQLIGQRFEDSGELLAEKETEAAVAEYARAKSRLKKAYDVLVKALTIEKKIVEAEAVREESRMILIEEATEDRKPEDRSRTKTKEVFLSDLQESKSSVGHGDFGKNGSLGYDGFRITVHGRVSEKGLSMHAISSGAATATYGVPSGATHFVAIAAIDDSAKDLQRTPVVFKIVGTNGLLWESKPLRGAGNTAECRIAIKGSQWIVLTVECPGDSYAARTVWVEPRFVGN